MFLSRGSIAHPSPFLPTTQRCWKISNFTHFKHPTWGDYNHCNLEDNADLFVMVKGFIVCRFSYKLPWLWMDWGAAPTVTRYVIQPSFFLSQHTKLGFFGFAPAQTRHNFSISPWNSAAKPVRFWLAPAQVWHRIRLKVYEVKSSLIRNVLISSL